MEGHQCFASRRPDATGIFHSYQHPEIVIFGLELDNMQKIVNNIGSAIKNGAKYEPGNE